MTLLCPAVLGHLGRMATGILWHVSGQARAADNGIYESPPYATGPDTPPRTWDGARPVADPGLSVVMGSLIRRIP